MDIPRKFYRTDDLSYPVLVSTVGELRKVLEELPDDLKVAQGLSDEGAEVVVYNVNVDWADPHLEIREPEGE